MRCNLSMHHGRHSLRQFSSRIHPFLLLILMEVMAALCSRCGHYIFVLWFLLAIFFLSSSFPRLISAVADWVSTILPHMVWPYCEFRMQVWNVLHVARWKYRMPKNIGKICHLRTIALAQLCRAISSQLRHLSTIGKKLVKQQYLSRVSLQYGEISVH